MPLPARQNRPGSLAWARAAAGAGFSLKPCSLRHAPAMVREVLIYLKRIDATYAGRMRMSSIGGLRGWISSKHSKPPPQKLLNTRSLHQLSGKNTMRRRRPRSYAAK